MLQSPPMTQTLLVAAELWQKSPSSDALETAAGFYGEYEQVKSASAQANFAVGKGPIGEVFATGNPRILTDLSELSFLHQEAAQTLSLGAVALIPSYEQGKVVSLVAMYFLGGEQAVGAVELWAGTKGRFELSLAQSYYAQMDRFARISQYVNFPMGAGLPGMCWETARPRIVPDLTTAKGFLRSSGAESDGLTVGLGLPIQHRTDLRAVVLLLSSAQTPIARVHEVWVQDPEDGDRITRSQGVYGGSAELAEATQGMSFSKSAGDGLPSKVWASGQPMLLDGLDEMADAGLQRIDAVREAGLRFALAMPVMVIDEVRSVVMLMG